MQRMCKECVKEYVKNVQRMCENTRNLAKNVQRMCKECAKNMHIIFEYYAKNVWVVKVCPSDLKCFVFGLKTSAAFFSSSKLF